MPELKVSFLVDRPLGVRAVMPVTTADGAWYDAFYRYERRGSAWWAVLESLTEIMPPAPPQIQGFGDTVRLHMMTDGAYDFEKEAEQRRQEWAEVKAHA